MEAKSNTSQYQNKHSEKVLAVPVGDNLGDGRGSFGKLARFLSQRSRAVMVERDVPIISERHPHELRPMLKAVEAHSDVLSGLVRCHKEYCATAITNGRGIIVQFGVHLRHSLESASRLQEPNIPAVALVVELAQDLLLGFRSPIDL